MPESAQPTEARGEAEADDVAQGQVPAGPPLAYAAPVRPDKMSRDGALMYYFTSLALKLLGGFALVIGVAYLRLLAALWDPGWMPREMVLAELSPLVVYVGAGVFLIVRSNYLAARLVGDVARDGGDGGPARPAGRRQRLGVTVQSVGFSIVGIYVAISAVGDLVRTAWSRYDPNTFDFRAPGWAAYIGPAVRGIIGVWLFLGARGLAIWWHRLRRTPLPGDSVRAGAARPTGDDTPPAR